MRISLIKHKPRPRNARSHKHRAERSQRIRGAAGSTVEAAAETPSGDGGRDFNFNINFIGWRAAAKSHWLRQMPRRSPPATGMQGVPGRGKEKRPRVKAGR